MFYKPPVTLSYYVVFFEGSSPSSAPELMSSRLTRLRNATGCQRANMLSPCPSSTMPAAASTASSAWVALRLVITQMHMHKCYLICSYQTLSVRETVNDLDIFLIIFNNRWGQRHCVDVCWGKGKVTKGVGIQAFQTVWSCWVDFLHMLVIWLIFF